MMKLMLIAHAESGGNATTANRNQMGGGNTQLTPKQQRSFQRAQERGRGGAWLERFNNSRGQG